MAGADLRPCGCDCGCGYVLTDRVHGWRRIEALLSIPVEQLPGAEVGGNAAPGAPLSMSKEPLLQDTQFKDPRSKGLHPHNWHADVANVLARLWCCGSCLPRYTHQPHPCKGQ